MRNPPPSFSPTYNLLDKLDPLYIPQKLMCEMCGVDDNTMLRLTDEGIIPVLDGGKYPLIEAVNAYIRYVKSDPAQQGIKFDIQQEQLRKLQINNDVANGILAPADQASRAFNEAMTLIKTNIEGIAPRVANEFAGTPDAAVIRRRLTEEHDAALATGALRLSDFFNSLPGRGVPATADALEPRPVGGRKPIVTRKRGRARKVAK